MGKGGARHTPKPQVDEGLLLKVFSNEQISSSHGCVLKGLVKALVDLEPRCKIHTSNLRKAIFSVLMEDPSLNDTRFSGTAWTNLEIERVTAFLYHMRRLAASDLKLRAARLSGAEYLQLQDVARKSPRKTHQFLKPWLRLSKNLL